MISPAQVKLAALSHFKLHGIRHQADKTNCSVVTQAQECLHDIRRLEALCVIANPVVEILVSAREIIDAGDLSLEWSDAKVPTNAFVLPLQLLAPLAAQTLAQVAPLLVVAVRR